MQSNANCVHSSIIVDTETIFTQSLLTEKTIGLGWTK